MKNIIQITAFLFLVSMASCVKPPEYPIEPRIEFISIENDSVKQNQDQIYSLVTFSFTDGDGDLGAATDVVNDAPFNIIFNDTRTEEGYLYYYKMPFIPKQGVADGISGEVTVKVRANCCTPLSPTDLVCQPNEGNPPEEIIYTIQVFDRAGNYSNTIEIDPIILICD